MPDNFFRSGPKRPPPAHGIKIKKAGSTWWGQRWIEALERMAPEYAKRMERGRSYARAGRTHDLSVEPGSVHAQVTGSRPKPYAVSLRLTQLTASDWQAAIAAMAAHAAFSAELLAGHMPQAIDEAFATAGVSLFPQAKRDLVTECNCPDYANPCKHVAACHYVLGEAFDRDPFLLFELRGRTREQVLAALRAARGGDASSSEPAAGVALTVALPQLSADDYDKPRAELPHLSLSFDAPPAHGALLQQLGKPAAWSGDGSPAQLLEPLVRAAAERARALALGEGEDHESEQPAAVAKPPRKPRKRR
ncbi:MAG TPA: SWIM zinc finger family protein [Polyangiales bacterium]|nr:SWIM zinc finger family protein [Polyangiales bacterium]